MFDLDNTTQWVILVTAAIVVVTFVVALQCFGTRDYTVALVNPTEEQILDLYKSSSEDDHFWVREQHSVKGERSITEATIGVRDTEGEDKIREVLDELGLEYYIVGKTTHNR